MIRNNINNYKLWKEKFEDTKWVIKGLKSKKNRQHNGRKKVDKRTNNDQQNMTQKIKFLHVFSFQMCYWKCMQK